MVEKSERIEVNRKDGDVSFCPEKIKLMRMTRLALCGQPSQKDQQVNNLAIWENREERTEGPNWFPIRRHRARFGLSRHHRVSERSLRIL